MFTERVWTGSIAPIDQAIHEDCSKNSIQTRFHFPLLPAWIGIILHPSDLCTSWLLLHMCYYYLSVCVKAANLEQQAQKIHRQILQFQPRNIGIRFQALLNEGIYPWSLNLFNSWLLTLSLEATWATKQETGNIKKLGTGKTSKKNLAWLYHYPRCRFFNHGFTADQSFWATQQCHQHHEDHHIQWCHLMNRKKLDIKNRFFKAGIRKFGGETFPGFPQFLEPRSSRCWG